MMCLMTNFDVGVCLFVYHCHIATVGYQRIFKTIVVKTASAAGKVRLCEHV